MRNTQKGNIMQFVKYFLPLIVVCIVALALILGLIGDGVNSRKPYEQEQNGSSLVQP